MTFHFNSVFHAFITEKFNFKTEDPETLYNSLFKEKYGHSITGKIITLNTCNGFFIPSTKKLFKTKNVKIEFETANTVPDIYISNNIKISARFSSIAGYGGWDISDSKIIQKITESWSPCFMLKSPLLYNVFSDTENVKYSINDENVFVIIYNGYTLSNKVASPLPYISPQKDFYDKKSLSTHQSRHFLISGYIDDGGQYLNTTIKHAHRETELTDLINF